MPYRDASPTSARCPRCTDEAAGLRRLEAGVAALDWAKPVEPAPFVDLRSPDLRARDDEREADAPLVVRLLDRLLSL